MAAYKLENKDCLQSQCGAPMQTEVTMTNAALAAAVSKAFSCLSDGDQRAAYDRYGDQEGTGLSGHRRAGPAGPGFGGDGFDAEEIFNMFFNGGFGGGTR